MKKIVSIDDEGHVATNWLGKIAYTVIVLVLGAGGLASMNGLRESQELVQMRAWMAEEQRKPGDSFTKDDGMHLSGEVQTLGDRQRDIEEWVHTDKMIIQQINDSLAEAKRERAEIRSLVMLVLKDHAAGNGANSD